MVSRDITILEFSQLLEFSTQQLIKIIHQTLEKQPRFTCALAGGKSPEKFYQALARYKREKFWNKVHIFSTDERFVPADHDYNNFRMIQKNLLSNLPIPKKNYHPMPTNVASPEIAAQTYNAHLQKFFRLKQGQFLCFDFILLGIGEDGHTASLFPISKQCREEKKMVIFFKDSEIEYERLSLTLPVLNNARHVAFFVHGAPKADILRTILKTESRLPAACVAPKKGKLFFWLDRKAGEKIHIL